MKYIIKVWKGRAYLHTRSKIGDFFSEGDHPLGNDPKFIKKMRDHYKCKVQFLNDDFTIEKILQP